MIQNCEKEERFVSSWRTLRFRNGIRSLYIGEDNKITRDNRCKIQRNIRVLIVLFDEVIDLSADEEARAFRDESENLVS